MNNYLQAARVLEGVLGRKGSIKTLALRSEIQNKVRGVSVDGFWEGMDGPPDMTLYFKPASPPIDLDRTRPIDAPPPPQKKKNQQRFVTALVSETLRYKAALDHVLNQSQLRQALRKDVRDPHLLYLLLFDLLYGKGIQGGGQVKRLLLAHEAALRAAAATVEAPPPPPLPPQGQASGEDGAAGAAGRFPRYARVNPLKTTVAKAVAALAAAQGGKGGGEGPLAEKGAIEVRTHTGRPSTLSRSDWSLCVLQRHTPMLPTYPSQSHSPTTTQTPAKHPLKRPTQTPTTPIGGPAHSGPPRPAPRDGPARPPLGGRRRARAPGQGLELLGPGAAGGHIARRGGRCGRRD